MVIIKEGHLLASHYTEIDLIGSTEAFIHYTEKVRQVELPGPYYHVFYNNLDLGWFATAELEFTDEEQDQQFLRSVMEDLAETMQKRDNLKHFLFCLEEEGKYIHLHRHTEPQSVYDSNFRREWPRLQLGVEKEKLEEEIGILKPTFDFNLSETEQTAPENNTTASDDQDEAMDV